MKTHTVSKLPAPLRWWLHLTAPTNAEFYDQAATPQQRELLRLSGLTSYFGGLSLLAPLFLLQQALNDSITAFALVILISISIFALFLNKTGKQATAAFLFIISTECIIEGAIVSAGNLGAGWLLSFDLLLIPLLFTGLLPNPLAILAFAFVHIGFILGDFYFMPHTQDLDALVKLWGGDAIAYARPILLQIFLGIGLTLYISSTRQAIIRADQSEARAALKEQLEQQKKQLELGIEELQKTLTYAANGHFDIRVSLPRENVLWQLAASLNNLLQRLNSSRQLDATVKQTRLDAERLAEALRALQKRQQPVWPLPSGGPLDPIIHELRSMVQTSSPLSSNTQQRTQQNFPPRQKHTF